MIRKAIFAGGCFWCTEAVFKRLRGVKSVVPGYTGGSNQNPDYQNIGNHAEAVKIEFDDEKIHFSDLLDVFFGTHDPTTMDRQGADVGEQYRSEIFYTTDSQKEDSIKKIEELAPKFKDKIVTKVTQFDEFYEAEDYHKDYYAKNSNAPYCRLVIDPKVKKLIENYSKLLK